MYKMYCVSIFINENELNNAFDVFKNNREIESKEIIAVDQLHIEKRALVINLAGIRVLFLPSNDFHKNRDFEIGITCDSYDSWIDMIQILKTNNLLMKYDKHIVESSEYMVVGNELTHGIITGMLDGKYSNLECIEKIETIVPVKEKDFFEKQVFPICEMGIKNKLSLLASNNNEYLFSNIVIANDVDKTFSINTGKIRLDCSNKKYILSLG